MLSYEITSPTDARKNFFKLLDLVTKNSQIYIINHRDGENVALISESDLKSLVETVYLFEILLMQVACWMGLRSLRRDK